VAGAGGMVGTGQVVDSDCRPKIKPTLGRVGGALAAQPGAQLAGGAGAGAAAQDRTRGWWRTYGSVGSWV
jgi:hypothetical protein